MRPISGLRGKEREKGRPYGVRGHLGFDYPPQFACKFQKSCLPLQPTIPSRGLQVLLLVGTPTAGLNTIKVRPARCHTFRRHKSASPFARMRGAFSGRRRIGKTGSLIVNQRSLTLWQMYSINENVLIF